MGQTMYLAQGDMKVEEGISQVTKRVKEMAALSCGYNISVEELARARVYWQKKNEKVQEEYEPVLSIESGDVKMWPKYKNQTILDISNNLSIVILALRLSDQGKYTCVVQKPEKGAFKLQHMTSVMLWVKANFPTPSITDWGSPSSDTRRIICSASEGFPEPHLSWLENGEELSQNNKTKVSQDLETELYTVSSELDFDVTNNHSFMCLIKYGGLTVNQTFNWKARK
ncbi:T-lymphocyte activation antigen CD80 [Carlito syrichta]|uniref:T-lymphocyte activation antigen CD80 n=1 Tax=Carlito syrichta TaxID=1868482 RepID=A0A3Q0DLX8_CARSF|nr:T-lymphocyte activation antigen CD80 [Carlito syrichta]